MSSSALACVLASPCSDRCRCSKPAPGCAAPAGGVASKQAEARAVKVTTGRLAGATSSSTRQLSLRLDEPGGGDAAGANSLHAAFRGMESPAAEQAPALTQRAALKSSLASTLSSMKCAELRRRGFERSGHAQADGTPDRSAPPATPATQARTQHRKPDHDSHSGICYGHLLRARSDCRVHDTRSPRRTMPWSSETDDITSPCHV